MTDFNVCSQRTIIIQSFVPLEVDKLVQPPAVLAVLIADDFENLVAATVEPAFTVYVASVDGAGVSLPTDFAPVLARIDSFLPVAHGCSCRE